MRILSRLIKIRVRLPHPQKVDILNNNKYFLKVENNRGPIYFKILEFI